MNHAAVSPCTRYVKEAILRHLESWTHFDEEFLSLVPFGGEGPGQGGTTSVKRVFAKFIRSKENEIAITPNTNYGINAVINSMKYPHGCNIVIADPRLEHPTAIPNMLREKKQVEIRFVYAEGLDQEIPLKRFEKAIDDKTILLFVNHVEYPNGLRNDIKALAEIAHEHGAYILVDAFQSAGMIDIDVKKLDVDFLSTGTYKWMMGIKGTGYLYAREDLIEKLEPTMVGWASGPWHLTYKEATNGWISGYHKSATRFEIGSGSIIGFIAAEAAIEFLMKVGMKNIEERVMRLTDYLIQRLQGLNLKLQTPLKPRHRSAIVNFKFKNPNEVTKKLRVRNIVVSGGVEHYLEGIRVSPHFYNTEDEVDRFILEIKKFL
jgi:selenocysteine lyase/cysteine desulfurase